MKSLTFSNGDHMPIIGLGTWKSAPGDVYDAVLTAIRSGYRHIDCAAIYQNEKEVGKAFAKAFADGLVKREDLWVTSKLWNDAHKKDDVQPALKQTLEDLQLDYLDLYLIHWPVALQPDKIFPQRPEDFMSLEEVPLTTTWAGMEAVAEKGLCKHIGVSNFNSKQIQELIDAGQTTPTMNQVEMHPYLQQRELVAYCKRKGIHMTAYSPLGSGDRSSRLKREDEPKLLDDKTIHDIAAQHQCTPAQVLISWSAYRDIAVIPKSTNPGRIRENVESAKVELNQEDMDRIAELDQHFRYIDGSVWTMEGAPYTLEQLWNE